MPIIKPTVGRVVHFYPHDPAHIDGAARLAAAHGQVVEADPLPQERPPLAALISKVVGDRLVNLMVIQPSGFPQGRENILLVQDGDKRPVDRSYCCWPPMLNAEQSQAPKAGAGTEKPKPTPSSPAPPAQPQTAKAQG